MKSPPCVKDYRVFVHVRNMSPLRGKIIGRSPPASKDAFFPCLKVMKEKPAETPYICRSQKISSTTIEVGSHSENTSVQKGLPLPPLLFPPLPGAGVFSPSCQEGCIGDCWSFLKDPLRADVVLFAGSFFFLFVRMNAFVLPPPLGGWHP